MRKRLLLMTALFFAVSLVLVLLPVGTASAQVFCGTKGGTSKAEMLQTKTNA